MHTWRGITEGLLQQRQTRKILQEKEESFYLGSKEKISNAEVFWGVGATYLPGENPTGWLIFIWSG